MRLLRLLPLLALSFLPACATITTGTQHTMAVVTDPAGASCELRRGGDLIGVIARTPATVRFGKSYRDIAVECAHATAGRGATTVSAGFQPMFLGNILLGGVIGMGVDIVSAAGADYPNTAYVTIQPSPQPPTAPGAAAPPVAAATPPASAPVASATSLEQRVAAARAACRRQGGRNCDAAAERAMQEWEREWQDQRGRT